MFVKINRKLLDSFCFANPNHLKVWIWLLLKANYKKAFIPIKTGRGVTTIEVDRGQFLYGRKMAEDELQMAGSTIERYLQKFKDLEQIIVEPNSLYSIITICKYDSYQNKTEASEQAMGKQWASNEQYFGQGNEQAMDTTKKNKNNKEEKEELEILIGFEKSAKEFLDDQFYKERFALDNKIMLSEVEQRMIEFVRKLRKKENYLEQWKTVASIKKYFSNSYAKEIREREQNIKENSGAWFSASTGGSTEVPKGIDYEDENIGKW
jgi:hypothetical protein